MKVAIVEYKTSKTAYKITSVLDLTRTTKQDLEETRKLCESRGGYFTIKSYKNF